jgi:hypothetical protein
MPAYTSVCGFSTSDPSAKLNGQNADVHATAYSSVAEAICLLQKREKRVKPFCLFRHDTIMALFGAPFLLRSKNDGDRRNEDKPKLRFTVHTVGGAIRFIRDQVARLAYSAGW